MTKSKHSDIAPDALNDNLLSNHNHLFSLARQGELRFPREKAYPFIVLIFASVAPFLGSFCLMIPLGLAFAINGTDPLQILDSAPGFTATMLVVFIPIFIMIWLWLKIFEKRPLSTIGLERAGAAAKYLRGLLVGLLLYGAVVGILALLGQVAVESVDPAVHGASALGWALFALIGWIVQGAAEEALSRGFLMPVIGIRWGVVASIILSAMLFSIQHILNSNIGWLPLFNLFLFGVFAALYALYEGGLWGIFAFHSMWNWVQGNLFGLEVSGSEMSTAIIFNLQETGPDWFTGGAFGPEGGMVVTIVLVASCITIWIAHKRRRAIQAG